MNDEKLTRLRTVRKDYYNRAYETASDVREAQKALDIANRHHRKSVRVYRRIDRLIAEEELRRRTIATEAKKVQRKKSSSDPMDKVVRAIKYLPADQQKAILTNLAKNIDITK